MAVLHLVLAAEDDRHPAAVGVNQLGLGHLQGIAAGVDDVLVHHVARLAEAGDTHDAPEVVGAAKGPVEAGLLVLQHVPGDHGPVVDTEGDLRQLAQWRDWGLKGFSGYVDYRKTIDLKNLDGKIVIDLGKTQHMAQVWINGIDCGMRLWPPFEYDITKALKPGKNNLHIRVGNLVNDSYNQPNESGLFGPIIILKKQTKSKSPEGAR